MMNSYEYTVMTTVKERHVPEKWVPYRPTGGVLDLTSLPHTHTDNIHKKLKYAPPTRICPTTYHRRLLLFTIPNTDLLKK